MNVLIVDDEERIRKLISDYLQNEGFTTIEAENGRIALDLIKGDGQIDLIILDVMMPEYDGWTVCREVRKISTVPIFMLTAREETSDEIFGLDLGADDYIRKPFSPRALVARVKSLERRLGEGEEPVFHTGVLEVNRKGRYITLGGKRLELAPKEYEFLLLLIDNKGQALSREQILNRVWDFDYYKGMRTVDTHVKKLRKKLGDYSGYIQTVRNFGYRFEVES